MNLLWTGVSVVAALAAFHYWGNAVMPTSGARSAHSILTG
jgi:hypothetical protein